MIPAHVRDSITRWFDKDPHATFYERIELQDQALVMYEALPFSRRYGKVLAHILSRMTLVIQDGENLVGGVLEIIPDEAQRRFAEALSSGWWGSATEEEKQRLIAFYYSPGWIKRRDPRFFSLGHLAFDWENILAVGLRGLQEKAQAVLDSGIYAADEAKTDFLSGAVEAYAAQRAFISRYGDEAEDLAAAARGEADRARLLHLRDICRHIASDIPRTFQEALQLIWFIVLISQKTAGCGVLCFARMDQYLYPFYREGLRDGSLTREAALGLIIEFYNKNNDIMTPADHMSQETEQVRDNLELTYDDPNYLILGGRLDAERSAVNELSFLFVEAAHELKLRNPFIVVRYHEGMDRKFRRAVCAAMRDNATLVIYNDDTMIPALRSYGVAEEDVYSYGFYGCNDPLIPAKEGGLRQLWFNLVWPLELAVSGGRPLRDAGGIPADNFPLVDRLIGLMSVPYYGLAQEGLQDPASMEEILERFRTQMEFLLDQYRMLMEADYAVEKETNRGRLRFEDLYLQGTIDAAEDWVTGGTKYHKITMQGSGLATVVDSLAAIEQAVFVDKRCTFAELRAALAADFQGNAELRHYLHSLPKYGNDVDSVDKYSAVVTNMYADAVQKLNAERKGLYSYMPCISTDRDFTRMGSLLGATADGRNAGASIGENQSPYQGADVSGATALFNSVSKIPFRRVTGGPLNVMLHPSTVEGEAGLEKLVALFDVYMKRGGMQIQLNVAGKEELREAQRHPDRYRSLCVRVVGYSAYFVQMGKTAQDELINRTVH